MTKIVLTYEDFATLPDDGRRYELHEGAAYDFPPSRREFFQRLGGGLLVIALPISRAATVRERVRFHPAP